MSIPNGLLSTVHGCIVEGCQVKSADKEGKPFADGPRYTANALYLGGKKYFPMTVDAYRVLEPLGKLKRAPRVDLVCVCTEDTFAGKTYSKMLVVGACVHAPGAALKLLAQVERAQQEEEGGEIDVDTGPAFVAPPQPGGPGRK